VSGAGPWPGGARGALCLSFDNLGEAAEIGAGALAPDAVGVGSHPTATTVLPDLLDRLRAEGLRATFFIEGMNAEIYPGLLREIDAAGHEVAYHAWAHERWGELPAAQQAENLARGIAAFGELGLDVAGMRPPAGALGEGGAEVLRGAGLTYCSPAGAGAGSEGGDLAVLPFEWRHVDASCVLPPLARVRELMTGSADPLEPDSFLAYLDAELQRLAEAGGFAAIVLHPFMLEWFGGQRLAALLERIAAASAAGALWVAPCREVAAHVLANAGEFAGATTLDPTGWSG
jgi:peptidoglycan/xylan/chitin deacetylase (PgdA/CDA1 family)